MKRSSSNLDYSKFDNRSSTSSSSAKSTDTDAEMTTQPTVSTQFNFHMDSEMPSWFSPAAAARTVATNPTSSQPHLPVRNANQDGWFDNDRDDETDSPASSAGGTKATTESKFPPALEFSDRTKAEQGVKPGTHAEDGYEDTDFSQRYTALLAAAGDGDVTAQYEIARMYASGIVDDLGMADAQPWLQRAADQGHAKAQQLLKTHFS